MSGEEAPDINFRAEVQRRIDALVPPANLTEMRKEYWKAGARAVIREVNEVLANIGKKS